VNWCVLEAEDRATRGRGEVFTRAKAWGHVPPAMTFEKYLVALDRGLDPYVEEVRDGSEKRFVA
jgi:hypothetical protein